MRTDYINYPSQESPLRTYNLGQSFIISSWAILIKLSYRAYELGLVGGGYLPPNYSIYTIGRSVINRVIVRGVCTNRGVKES
jgi:hypothetical protein